MDADRSTRELTGIIPAAGLGSRMAPITTTLPKSLVLINGKTLLCRAVESLKSLGVSKIIVVAGHLREAVSEYVDDVLSRESIKVIVQESQLGLPHAIHRVRAEIDHDCVIYCPDNIYSYAGDIHDACDVFLRHKPAYLQTVTVVPNRQVGRCVYYTSGLNNFEANVFSKTVDKHSTEGLSLYPTGVTFLSQKALAYLPKAFDKNHAYPMWAYQERIDEEYPSLLYLLKGMRYDITTPEDVVQEIVEIPERPIERFGVSVLLLTKDRRVFLQKRDDVSHIRYPALWGLFGGSSNLGETPVEAITREVREEIGVNLDTLGLVRCFHENGKQEYAFAAEIGTDVSGIKLQEGSECRLFSFSEIETVDIRPDDRETIQLYVDGGEQ